MSRLYGEQHRALQDKFHTRKLADHAEEVVVQTEVGDTALVRCSLLGGVSVRPAPQDSRCRRTESAALLTP